MIFMRRWRFRRRASHKGRVVRVGGMSGFVGPCGGCVRRRIFQRCKQDGNVSWNEQFERRGILGQVSGQRTPSRSSRSSR